MDRLSEYDWPGNVRQLKNVAERLIVRARGNAITLDDLPRDVALDARPAAVAVAVSAPSADLAAAPRAQTAAEELFERMMHDRESFWTAVYPAFMTRDLTRNDLRFIVSRGLQETAGSYKLLVELLNMRPSDYKRFLNFLRKHECRVPFERFRSARHRGRGLADSDTVGSHAPADSDPALEELLRMPADDDALLDRLIRH
jgi:hypothetical protein